MDPRCLSRPARASAAVTRLELVRRPVTGIGAQSKDNDHRPLRDLFVDFADVIDVHHHTTPREMTWAVIRPFPGPTVKSDAAAQTCALEGGRSNIPLLADRRLLLWANYVFRSGSRRVKGI